MMSDGQNAISRRSSRNDMDSSERREAAKNLSSSRHSDVPLQVSVFLSH